MVLAESLLSVFAIITDPFFLAGAFISALLLHKRFHKTERLAVLVVFLAAVVAVSAGLAFSAKLLFQVPRPCVGAPGCPTDFGFPSGHAMISFAFFSFLFFLNSRWRASELILAFPLLIAVLRVVQGVHTFWDVLAGAMLGVFIGLVSYRLHERIVRPPLPAVGNPKGRRAKSGG